MEKYDKATLSACNDVKATLAEKRRFQSKKAEEKFKAQLVVTEKPGIAIRTLIDIRILTHLQEFSKSILVAIGAGTTACLLYNAAAEMFFEQGKKHLQEYKDKPDKEHKKPSDDDPIAIDTFALALSVSNIINKQIKKQCKNKGQTTRQPSGKGWNALKTNSSPKKTGRTNKQSKGGKNKKNSKKKTSSQQPPKHKQQANLITKLKGNSGTGYNKNKSRSRSRTRNKWTC